MIYKPQETLDLRNFLLGGLVKALTALAADFNAGTNKPWTYYLGVGIGGACAATGVPGAASTAYVVAKALDVWIFHSADGSIVRAYVNGLERAVIDASTGGTGWVKHSFTLDNVDTAQRFDLVNGEPGTANTSGISWMAISQLETPGIVYQKGQGDLQMVLISHQITDADGQTNALQTFIDGDTLTDNALQGFAQEEALRLDLVIDGAITDITVTRHVPLPAGIKVAPVANCEVQKGANWQFKPDNTNYSWTPYIPSFKPSLFVGNLVNQANADVTSLRTLYLSGLTVNSEIVIPTDEYGNSLATLTTSYKTFHRKAGGKTTRK